MDALPLSKLRLDPPKGDKLATHEPQAPVPSDFPGKKPEHFARVVVQGDFEMKDHFYERCRLCLPRGR
jgi:hypothetical protein